MVDARLEYFNTTLSDTEEMTFDLAVSDETYRNDWLTIEVLDDSISDTGTFEISVPGDVGIKYLRLISDSWLAVGTFRPNVTGCYNSTLNGTTAV